MKQSIINMVWVGDAISPIEALCMKSFVQNGMHVKLNAYNLVGGHKMSSCVMRTQLFRKKKCLNTWGVMQRLQIYFAGS